MRVKHVYPSHERPAEAMRVISEAINRLSDGAQYDGVISVTSSSTVTADFGFWVGDATSATVVMTVPPAEAHKGKSFSFKKIDASVNEVQVTPSDGTVDGAASVSLTSQWDAVTITSDGDNWLITARI